MDEHEVITTVEPINESTCGECGCDLTPQEEGRCGVCYRESQQAEW